MHIQKIAQASRPRYKLVECISVARVRPRTSKGITDLLLPPTSCSDRTESPSKKSSTSMQALLMDYLAGGGLVR